MSTIIVQQRVTSSRLPNKANLPLVAGYSVTDMVLRRVMPVRNGDVYLAVPNGQAERIPLISNQWVRVYEGPEDDVLGRYYGVCRKHGHYISDTIVRITGDCPLVDAREVRRLLDIYRSGLYDYVSNAHPIRTVHHGFDVEIFSRDALTFVHFTQLEHDVREHVTPYFYYSGGPFRCYKDEKVDQYNFAEDNLSVDDEKSYQKVKALIEKLYDKYGFDFTMKQALDEYYGT